MARYTVRVSRRPEHLATGYVRVAGLLTLLIGIAVMHVFIAAHTTGHATEQLAAQSITHRSTARDTAGDPAVPMAAHSALDSHEQRPTFTEAAAAVPSMPETTAAPATGHHEPSMMAALTSMTMRGDGMGPGCADGCCPISGGTHACVFILTALILLLGLAFLGRVGDGPDASTRTVRGWAARYARPPPWTTPSLAELSILRI